MAFPRFYNDLGFAPLFRLLDDFDSYTRQQSPRVSSFHPRFDVRELGDSYELYGELPGMKKDEVEIQFSDPQTMLIRGRIERSYTSGTPPAGLVEGTSPAGTITEKGEEQSKGAEEKRSRDVAKYWVSERSVGEFSRSFNFPGPVDQNSVTASFKDGILSIVVPKAKKPEARRIAIE